jgi:ABC-2 type transport system ATP-binding protein
MIQIQSLTKDFGSRTVVDNLSFEVRPGVVTGFLGPNGAGKSTTMRMILGLDRPTSGQALIDGMRYRDLPRPLTTMGALLDARWVHGQRSARAHLAWLAASNDLPRHRVDEVLDLVGLTEVAGQKAGSLSLGMSQRLGLAVALLGDPQYLLLDEPDNGLDPEGIVWIRRIMKRLAAQGRTVFVSSHLLAEMALTADHLVVIAAGRLIADMSVQAFIADSANGSTGSTGSTGSIRVRARDLGTLGEALAGAGASLERLDDGLALRVRGLSAERIGEVAARAGSVVYEIYEEHGSLEDAFMRRTEDTLQYRSADEAKVTR